MPNLTSMWWTSRLSVFHAQSSEKEIIIIWVRGKKRMGKWERREIHEYLIFPIYATIERVTETRRKNIVACATQSKSSRARKAERTKKESSAATAIPFVGWNRTRRIRRKAKNNFYVFGSRICKWLIGWYWVCRPRFRQCWFSWNIYVRWKWNKFNKSRETSSEHFRF